MNKKNKRRKFGWGICTLIILISVVGNAYFLFNDIVSHHSGNLFKDITNLIISIIITIISYYEMKNIGTTKDEEDDERDKYLKMKTESQVFRILNWLLFIVGAIFYIWGLVLGKTVIDTRTIILFVIGFVLLISWFISLVLELILAFVNYRRD